MIARTAGPGDSTNAAARSATAASSSASGTLTSASPTAGNTYELTAIAGVVIGGAALSGGRGNVRGTLLNLIQAFDIDAYGRVLAGHDAR